MNSWFVSVEKGGPLGPVSIDVVVRALLAGNVSPHAQVALGSPNAEWRPIMSVPEVIAAVSVAGNMAAEELARTASTVYLGPHLKSTVQLPPNLALAEAKMRQDTEISPKPSIPAPPPLPTSGPAPAPAAKADATTPKAPAVDSKLRIVLPVGIFGAFAAVAVLEMFVVLATRGIP
ncbi:hypothetical protein AKJ09_04884 [Labilithrix luteola]|uniref:GYF domain-containing protein n=1 Tax=Labilithrix luteola TaxID=1391654 RepID=A0A0K1PXH0_9BACT|nr:hypothetical protein [Labilithrix luteola]AKU98220.1 hypothetical protein AKJ09_04884 [Labilithrix luteola]